MEDRHVLVVDNDPHSRERIARSLLDRRIVCDEAATAEEALERAQRDVPDLVIVDLYLPDQSGLGFCRVLRETPRLARIPVIVVSGHSSEIDRIMAFEAGADDFVPKPFYPLELAARVSAVLRGFLDGAPSGCGSPAEARGPVAVDAQLGRVEVRGERVDLTPTEFELLSTLASRAGRVVRRQELIDRRWSSEGLQSDRAIDTHIKNLRRKLGSARDCIETVRGVGYRFSDGG